MLVIRRRAGESIVVNGDITIEVVEVSRTRVKLGIRAPHYVPVSRSEALPVARENRLASELVASEGAVGLNEILRLVHRIAAVNPSPAHHIAPQGPSPQADM